MTPRTRTSNKDANYKIYYSKKVPKQVYFPHKKKTVRRPESAEQDGVEKRQMNFLPKKMRQQKSEAEEGTEGEKTEEESIMQEAATEETAKSTPVNRRRSKKRNSNDVGEGSVSDEEPVTTSSKRRRRTTAPKEEPSRTLRRQSTMTQLADGRRPSISADEPDFKLVKRRSRVSWGGVGTERERDKKQRTLTQMIPGMGRLSKKELEEMSDLDAELEEDQTSNDVVSQSLIEQGLLELDGPTHGAAAVQQSGDAEDDSAKVREENEHDLPIVMQEQASVIIQSIEGMAEDDDEEDYQPTQFIEAPSRRTRQTPRRTATRQPSSKADRPEKSAKSRFNLLSTPEKRRIFEIPSSQSPAESVLSTQTSPQKSNRSILRQCTTNMTIVAETPSKRRQVTFQEHTVQRAPPASLRKFESTIQDSEDEEGSDIGDDITEQDQMDGANQSMHGQAIGADTQAVLQQIDLACANEDDNLHLDSRGSSGEPEEPSVRQRPHQSSPELGESWAPVIYDDDGPGYGSYRSAHSGSKSQSLRDADASKESLPVLDQTNEISQLDMTTQLVPADNIPSTPPMIQPQPDEDLPSTPMVIGDKSSEEEDAEPEPTPPRTVQRIVPQPLSTLLHQSTDLDGESVQVPRSPSADRETQQSHSSKAEQQLQSEWLSYSQYVHARAPNSSSMHAAADAFSCNATPQLLRTGALVASSARVQHSQATTVDEVTPRKNRTQRVVSANTTPHRISKSQPFVSPEKPPSLFIPSSFPSPSRAAMGGWSSPVMARTQNGYGSSQVLGSLEDFSIPLPPPVED
ncbi:hypothetical protein BU25DRAFT_409679, partial [Macroventuria anomochaeta]